MVDLMDRLERFYGPLPLPPDDPFGLYVWEVLGVHTTPARRSAAMSALRRIPALTPDSMGRAPRAGIEGVVAMAGPYREERLRALTAGVDVFKRHPDLPERLRGDMASAKEALRLLPHLSTVSAQWVLLFAGRHPLLPDDPHLGRVLNRLRKTRDAVARELGGVLPALQRASMYLSHHGRATCLESDPMCHICPLRSNCPYPNGAAA
jgi:endonuclease III